ncbi:hypothetical protein Glove_624g36 [Diversispora epigaea]|uniref:Uncharacterized protein n=1 Tax=Diversispora epigaea TaxID=1348612 RepID=A0A397G6W8_9GLOM|nr:hypothetical protein Glove_624g36 [Diversispora epigaea]
MTLQNIARIESGSFHHANSTTLGKHYLLWNQYRDINNSCNRASSPTFVKKSEFTEDITISSTLLNLENWEIPAIEDHEEASTSLNFNDREWLDDIIKNNEIIK